MFACCNLVEVGVMSLDPCPPDLLKELGKFMDFFSIALSSY